MTDETERRESAAEQAAETRDAAPDPNESSQAGSGTAAAHEGPVEDATEPDEVQEQTDDDLRTALDAAERTAEEYLDHLRRERAEFENFRKRVTKERMEALDRGAESIVASLLGVLDNFGYTLDAAASSSDDQLAKGVEMVHDELVKVLTEAGLEPVPGVGELFDPNVHEAMMQVDAAEELGEEVDEPVVAEVLRPGYRFKGRVLRPASVKVAR